MFRRSLELVAGAGVAALLTMASLIYVGRVFGPSEYADFAAGLAIIYFVGLALSPVVPTVARNVSLFAVRDDRTSIAALRRSLWRYGAIAGTIVIAVVLVAIGPLASWLRFRTKTPLLLGIVSALLYVALSVDRGFLQGLFRFRAYNANTIVEAGVRALLIFTLCRAFPTAGFATAAWLAGTAAALVMTAAVLASKPAPSTTNTSTTWDEFVSMLGPMIVLMASLAVFQNTDLLAVKRWFTSDAAGSYGAASALTRGFGAIFVPLYSLAGPYLTREHERGGDVRRATLLLSGGYLALVAVPLLVITVWGRGLMIALYGVAFAAGAEVIAPLSVITIFSYVGLMLTQGLISVRDYRFVYAYAAGSIAQIVSLALLHDSLRTVLTAIACAQGISLLLVTVVFLNSQKIKRDGSKSSSV